MELSSETNAPAGTQPKAGGDVQRRKAITAAAIAVASSVAPGQRERVVAEYAYSASGVADQSSIVNPKRNRYVVPDESLEAARTIDGLYECPEWGEMPPTEDADHLSLDVIKDGSLLESIPIISKNSYVTFGRSPIADVRLDHQSISRLHAVLQFGGDGKVVFLVDMGSTHGSALNGQQMQPLQYYRLPVGCQFTFGHSTRVYAFNAPQAWQLPEGPNREQRRRARMEQAVLQQAAAAAARDKLVAEKTMQAALHGGLEQMAEDVEAGSSDEIDWRVKMEAGGLSDKQMKLAESIRSKEYKLQRTQEAADRLRRHEQSDHDLTSGQAAALLNNEKAIDRLQAEIDDLEDTMQESLRDSLHGREAQLKGRQRQKRHRKSVDSESDGDDEFFDRTKRKNSKPAGRAVVTVKNLLAKLEELQTEEEHLASQIADAELKLSKAQNAMSACDDLDSLMLEEECKGARADLEKLNHLRRLTQEQMSQQRDLLDIADPHKEQRLALGNTV